MDVRVRSFLNVRGIVAVPRHGDVVDEVSVARTIGAERAGVPQCGVQVIFVAGIVDNPEIRDDEGVYAPSAIPVNNIINDQRRRSIGGARGVGSIAEIQNNSVAIGMVGRTVVFAHNNIVGDDVVEAAISVEPLVAVEGDPAGPTVPLRYAGGRRHVAVMVDYVVIGREIVAVPGANPGSSRGTHGVPDKTQMVSALAKESVTRIAMAVEI